VTGAAASVLRSAARSCAVAGAAAALLAAPACGKKAPLRLPDQRPVEHAATPRPSIREGRLILAFVVPAHRVFPEREEPWVLARVLRRQPPATDFVEVGAIFEKAGFPFGGPLTWTEEAQTGGTSVYRIEFRDAGRRRRALSEPVEVVWQAPPAAPGRLTAAGDDRAVTLSWDAPAGATGSARYRLFRREVPLAAAELLTPDPLEALRHTDARVQASHEYCYQVQAVLGAAPLEITGPPSEEVCVRTEDVTPPPPPAAIRLTAIPGGFQLVWDDVAAGDLLGYRVYRSIDEGPLELLTPAPLRGTAFRDDTGAAPAGARFRYVVTAIDASARPNESPFSPAVEAPALPPSDAR
jgi:hypothetical protein